MCRRAFQTKTNCVTTDAKICLQQTICVCMRIPHSNLQEKIIKKKQQQRRIEIYVRLRLLQSHYVCVLCERFFGVCICGWSERERRELEK